MGLFLTSTRIDGEWIAEMLMALRGGQQFLLLASVRNGAAEWITGLPSDFCWRVAVLERC